MSALSTSPIANHRLIERLSSGQDVFDPDAAQITTAIAECLTRISQALAHPHCLRTPIHAVEVTAAARQILHGVADVLEAVASWQSKAIRRGEISDATPLGVETAVRSLRDQLRSDDVTAQFAALDRALLSLRYTGQPFGTYSDQIAGIVHELSRRKVMVTANPLDAPRYRDPVTGRCAIAFSRDGQKYMAWIGADVCAEWPYGLGYPEVHPVPIVDYIMGHLDQFRPSPHPKGPVTREVHTRAPRFEDQQLEILDLIAEGLTNEQIATKLTMSLSTAKAHIRRIYVLLNVKSRTAAVTKARRLHLIDE